MLEQLLRWFDMTQLPVKNTFIEAGMIDAVVEVSSVRFRHSLQNREVRSQDPIIVRPRAQTVEVVGSPPYLASRDLNFQSVTCFGSWDAFAKDHGSFFSVVRPRFM